MKNIKPLPPLHRLKDLFDYEPDTGLLARKIGTVNGPVGSYVGSSNGIYAIVWVDGERYRLHRVAWYMHYGCQPPLDKEIDHINGNKQDNRISNLRIASPAQNIQAQGNRKNNQSGVRGVNFDKQTGRWRARIEVNKKQIMLGRFFSFEEACRVRREAEKEHFKEFAPKW